MFRLAALPFALVAVATQAGPAARPAPEIVVETADAERFFALYDAAGGQPDAAALQRYIDEGSDGLRTLARLRNVTGVRMAEAIASQPETYRKARNCLTALPEVKRRLHAALARFTQLYPTGRYPPISIVVGRARPVAIGSPVTGVQVGLEALCAADRLTPNITDRFVFTIVHEYAHVQQVTALVDDPKPTVLEGSLVEGAAELMAQLAAGSVANTYLTKAVRGREAEIERAFLPDIDKTDTDRWFYNGVGTKEWPGDLGYWVGYRIVKTYYDRARDKRAALRRILEMDDPKALLAESGWRPEGATRK